tara:strand:+ start:2804 stop:3025 length:222 start_codon:yes stop_codon:yes gene_type:complete
MRFGVVEEHSEFLDKHQASVAALTIRNWMLNPTIELIITTRLQSVMETEDVKEQASKEALSRRNWMLNPEIEM